MKAIFVHSARFLCSPQGTVFSSGQFPYEGWERYLKHFDELTVICRMSFGAQVPTTWNKSSGPRVSFVGTPDDHGRRLMQLDNRLKVKIIRQQLTDADAVIVRQSSLGFLAAQEAQREGIPWAVEVVSDAWDAYWNYGSPAGKLYAPVALLKSRYWISRAKFAIYVTRDYLQRQYPCKNMTCGASNVQIDPVPGTVLEQRILRRDPGQATAATAPVIGMIGSLFHRYKGLHIALRALRRLQDRGLRPQLRVLGSGPVDNWRREAEQLSVAELFFLEGSLPSGKPVGEWLDRLDMYIQPSFQEGLPRAMIEAMSRGLPALGSTCGGIPELLPAECLHRPGDDTTLAQQLERMIKDNAWRQEQARRNFNEAKLYYSDVVEAKRDAFWRQFWEYAKAKVRPGAAVEKLSAAGPRQGEMM